MWIVAIVGHIGTFLQLTAAPWVMWQLTSSAFMVSLVTAFVMLPRMFLALPAGALADRVDRRTLLAAGNACAAVSAGLMAGLAHLGALTPSTILLLMLALGSSVALTMPAFHTWVPDLVPRPLMPLAIGLNSGAFNVARAVGPAIGGVLVAAGLAELSFALNSVSFILVVLTVLSLPGDPPGDSGAGTSSVLRSTVTGLRYARFTGPIRHILVVAGAFSLTAGSVQALLAPVAAELDVGGTGFGVLWGCFGAGAMSGVLLRQRLNGQLNTWMVPASMVAFGTGGLVLGLSNQPVVSGLGIWLAGFGWVSVMITLNSSVQLLAPGWARSRIVGVFAVVVGLQPVGALTSGLMAEFVGSRTAVAVFAGLTLVVGLLARLADLPALDGIDAPVAAGLSGRPSVAESIVEGRVVVTRTWRVPAAKIDEFLICARDVRRVRRRTGASKWRLQRDAFTPGVFVEVIEYNDWQEHLTARTRLDMTDVAVLERLRAMDRNGAPETRVLGDVRL